MQAFLLRLYKTANNQRIAESNAFLLTIIMSIFTMHWILVSSNQATGKIALATFVMLFMTVTGGGSVGFFITDGVQSLARRVALRFAKGTIKDKAQEELELLAQLDELMRKQDVDFYDLIEPDDEKNARAWRKAKKDRSRTVTEWAAFFSRKKITKRVWLENLFSILFGCAATFSSLVAAYLAEQIMGKENVIVQVLTMTAVTGLLVLLAYKLEKHYMPEGWIYGDNKPAQAEPKDHS